LLETHIAESWPAGHTNPPEQTKNSIAANAEKKLLLPARENLQRLPPNREQGQPEPGPQCDDDEIWLQTIAAPAHALTSGALPKSNSEVCLNRAPARP